MAVTLGSTVSGTKDSIGSVTARRRNRLHVTREANSVALNSRDGVLTHLLD